MLKERNELEYWKAKPTAGFARTDLLWKIIQRNNRNQTHQNPTRSKRRNSRESKKKQLHITTVINNDNKISSLLFNCWLVLYWHLYWLFMRYNWSEILKDPKVMRKWKNSGFRIECFFYRNNGFKFSIELWFLQFLLSHQKSGQKMHPKSSLNNSWASGRFF